MDGMEVFGWRGGFIPEIVRGLSLLFVGRMRIEVVTAVVVGIEKRWLVR